MNVKGKHIRAKQQRRSQPGELYRHENEQKYQHRVYKARQDHPPDELDKRLFNEFANGIDIWVRGIAQKGKDSGANDSPEQFDRQGYVKGKDSAENPVDNRAEKRRLKPNSAVKQRERKSKTDRQTCII